MARKLGGGPKSTWESEIFFIPIFLSALNAEGAREESGGTAINNNNNNNNTALSE